MIEDNIVKLVPKDKEETTGYIKVVHTDNRETILPCDSFGAYESLPGFIIAFTDDNEANPTFFNSQFVKSISVLKDYTPDNFLFV